MLVARQNVSLEGGGYERASRDRRRDFPTKNSEACLHCSLTLGAIGARPFAHHDPTGVASVNDDLVATVATKSDRDRARKSSVD